MYGVNRGDARATAPPNARERSSGDAHVPSMPSDHAGGWADPRAHADARGPYGRDLRPDRDRTDRFGGKRGWTDRGGFPRSSAPLVNSGALEPPSKRRFPGRPFYGGENGRYGAVLRGAEPGVMVGPGVGGENVPVARKFERDVFYNGRAVNGGPFHGGAGGDYRGKDVEERRPFSREVFAGPAEGHDGSGLPLEPGPRAAAYHGQPYDEPDSAWDREGPGRAKDGSGWDLPPHEREHRDRGLRLKPEQYHRSGGLNGSSFSAVTHHDVSRDWVAGAEKEQEGGRLERYGRDLGSRDNLWGSDTLGGREAGSTRSWRLHGGKERVGVAGSETGGGSWSTTSLQSPASGNGTGREPVTGLGRLASAGDLGLPTSTTQQQPLSSPVVVGSAKGGETSAGSPPPKRTRLGWGQGLAKYEKKKVEVEEPAPDGPAMQGGAASSDVQGPVLRSSAEEAFAGGSLQTVDSGLSVVASMPLSGSNSKLEETKVDEGNLAFGGGEKGHFAADDKSAAMTHTSLHGREHMGVELAMSGSLPSSSELSCDTAPTIASTVSFLRTDSAADGNWSSINMSDIVPLRCGSGTDRVDKTDTTTVTHRDAHQKSLLASVVEPSTPHTSVAPVANDTMGTQSIFSEVIGHQGSGSSRAQAGTSHEDGADDEGDEEGPVPMDIEPAASNEGEAVCEQDTREGGQPGTTVLEAVKAEFSQARDAGDIGREAHQDGVEEVRADEGKEFCLGEQAEQIVVDEQVAVLEQKARGLEESRSQEGGRSISPEVSAGAGAAADGESFGKADAGPVGHGRLDAGAEDAVEMEAAMEAESQSPGRKAAGTEEPLLEVGHVETATGTSEAKNGDRREGAVPVSAQPDLSAAAPMHPEGPGGLSSSEAHGTAETEDGNSTRAADVQAEDVKAECEGEQMGEEGEEDISTQKQALEREGIAADVSSPGRDFAESGLPADGGPGPGLDGPDVDARELIPTPVAPGKDDKEVLLTIGQTPGLGEEVSPEGPEGEAGEEAKEDEGAVGDREQEGKAGLGKDSEAIEGHVDKGWKDGDGEALLEAHAKDVDHQGGVQGGHAESRVLQAEARSCEGEGKGGVVVCGNRGTGFLEKVTVKEMEVEDAHRRGKAGDAMGVDSEEQEAAEIRDGGSKQEDDEDDRAEGRADEAELKSQGDILAEMEKVDLEIEQLQKELEQILTKEESLARAQACLREAEEQRREKATAGIWKPAEGLVCPGPGWTEISAEERKQAEEMVAEEVVAYSQGSRQDTSSHSGNEDKEMERDSGEVEQAAAEMAPSGKTGRPEPLRPDTSASCSPVGKDEAGDVPMAEAWREEEDGPGEAGVSGGIHAREPDGAASTVPAEVEGAVKTAQRMALPPAGVEEDLQSGLVAPTSLSREETGETSLQRKSAAESEAKMEASEWWRVKAEPDVRQLSVQDALHAECRAGIMEVLEENRQRAKAAQADVTELLPWNMPSDGTILYASPCETLAWKTNCQRHEENLEKLQNRLREECGLQTAIVRALAVKYRALRDLWHQDLRVNGNRRMDRPTKEKVLTKQGSERARNGMLPQLSQRSSLRLRTTALPGGAEAETSEMTDGELLENQAAAAVQRLMNEAPPEPRSALQMPSMLLGDGNLCARRFVCSNGFVDDPEALEQERKAVCTWTEEERQIFLEKYAQFNKNFSAIASFLKHKTVADCVEFYYRNQKSEDFDRIRRRQQLKKRRDYSRGASYMATTAIAASRQRDVRARQMSFGAGPQSGREGMRPVRSASQRGPDRQRSSAILPAALPAVRPAVNAAVVVEEKVEAKVVGGNAGKTELLVMQTTVVSSGGQTTAPTGGHAMEAGQFLPELPLPGVGGSLRRGELGVDASVEDLAASILWSATQEIRGSGHSAVVGHTGPSSQDEATGREEKWTAEEEQRFLEGVRRCGKDYASIAEHIGSKTAAQCKAFFLAKKRLLLDTSTGPPPALLEAPTAELESVVQRAKLGASGIGDVLSPLLLPQLAHSAPPQDFVLPLPEQMVEVEAAPAEEEEAAGSQHTEDEDAEAGDMEEGEVMGDEDEAEAVDVGDCGEGDRQVQSLQAEQREDEGRIREAVTEDAGNEVDEEKEGEVEDAEEVEGSRENEPSADILAEQDHTSQADSQEQGEGETSGRDREGEEAGIGGDEATDTTGGEAGGEDGKVQALKDAWQGGALDDQPHWVREWMAARFGQMSQKGGNVAELTGREDRLVGSGGGAQIMRGRRLGDGTEHKRLLEDDFRLRLVAEDHDTAAAHGAPDRGEGVGLPFLPATGDGLSWQSMVAEKNREEGDVTPGLLANGSLSAQMLLQKPLARTPLAKVQAGILGDRLGSRTGAGSPALSVASGASSGSGGSVPAVREKDRDKEKAGRGGEKDGVKVRREPTSWMPAEKALFADIHAKHGKDWARLQEALPNKSMAQIKTYFQNSKAKLGITQGTAGASGRGGSRKRKVEEVEGGAALAALSAVALQGSTQKVNGSLEESALKISTPLASTAAGGMGGVVTPSSAPSGCSQGQLSMLSAAGPLGYMPSTLGRSSLAGANQNGMLQMGRVGLPGMLSNQLPGMIPPQCGSGAADVSEKQAAMVALQQMQMQMMQMYHGNGLPSGVSTASMPAMFPPYHPPSLPPLYPQVMPGLGPGSVPGSGLGAARSGHLSGPASQSQPLQPFKQQHRSLWQTMERLPEQQQGGESHGGSSRMRPGGALEDTHGGQAAATVRPSTTSFGSESNPQRQQQQREQQSSGTPDVKLFGQSLLMQPQVQQQALGGSGSGGPSRVAAGLQNAERASALPPYMMANSTIPSGPSGTGGSAGGGGFAAERKVGGQLQYGRTGALPYLMPDGRSPAQQPWGMSMAPMWMGSTPGQRPSHGGVEGQEGPSESLAMHIALANMAERVARDAEAGRHGKSSGGTSAKEAHRLAEPSGRKGSDAWDDERGKLEPGCNGQPAMEPNLRRDGSLGLGLHRGEMRLEDEKMVGLEAGRGSMSSQAYAAFGGDWPSLRSIPMRSGPLGSVGPGRPDTRGSWEEQWRDAHVERMGSDSQLGPRIGAQSALQMEDEGLVHSAGSSKGGSAAAHHSWAMAAGQPSSPYSSVEHHRMVAMAIAAVQQQQQHQQQRANSLGPVGTEDHYRGLDPRESDSRNNGLGNS